MWYALLIFPIIVLAIGNIEYFKSYKDKLSYGEYVKRWIQGIASSFYYLGYALTGAGKSKQTVAFDRGDSTYADISKEDFIAAAKWANKVMNYLGMDLEEYEKHSNDCDDYAWVKAALIKFSLRNKIGQNGAPVGVVAYKRDSDNALHALIQVMLDGKRVFMEGFPEYLEFKELSQKEIDSIYKDFL